MYKHARGQFRQDTAPRTQRVGNGHGVLKTDTLFQKVLHKAKYIPDNCTICMTRRNPARACPPISIATKGSSNKCIQECAYDCNMLSDSILYEVYRTIAVLTHFLFVRNVLLPMHGACLYSINTWHLLHIIIKTHFVRFYNQKSTRSARGLLKRTRSASVSFWDVGTRVACLYSI